MRKLNWKPLSSEPTSKKDYANDEVSSYTKIRNCMNLIHEYIESCITIPVESGLEDFVKRIGDMTFKELNNTTRDERKSILYALENELRILDIQVERSLLKDGHTQNKDRSDNVKKMPYYATLINTIGKDLSKDYEIPPISDAVFDYGNDNYWMNGPDIYYESSDLNSFENYVSENYKSVIDNKNPHNPISLNAIKGELHKDFEI